MSWKRYHQRRQAMDIALTRATRDPSALPYSEHPLVEAAFESRTELLLALQYTWSQQLNGRLELALYEADRNDTDRVEAVADAWRRTARENPVLRRVLDAHLDGDEPALKRAREDEARELAVTAGLAERIEPAEEASRIGAAFTALLRTRPSTPQAGRRNPMRRLSERLASR